MKKTWTCRKAQHSKPCPGRHASGKVAAWLGIRCCWLLIDFNVISLKSCRFLSNVKSGYMSFKIIITFLRANCCRRTKSNFAGLSTHYVTPMLGHSWRRSCQSVFKHRVCNFITTLTTKHKRTLEDPPSVNYLPKSAIDHNSSIQSSKTVAGLSSVYFKFK